MLKRHFAALLGLLAMFHPPHAVAAPFCVQAQGIAPECFYVDAGQCRQRATELKGLCVANKEELVIRPGTGKHCLVDSSLVTQCIYADRTSCDQEAARRNAVCIDAPSDMIQPDPYMQDPNRKY